MNEFKKMISKLDSSDIEEAQTRDFYSWLNYLVEYPQGVYDMLLTESDVGWSNLTEEEVKERKAVLDLAFVYLQSAMEDITTVLKEKYPNDMEKAHNRIVL